MFVEFSMRYELISIVLCLLKLFKKLAAGAASVAYGDGALRAPSPFGAKGYAAGSPWA